MFKKLLLFIFTLAFCLIIFSPAQALEDCTDKQGDDAAQCWNDREQELKEKIAQAQGQQKTLANAIDYLDDKVALTLTQISQTKEELKVLENDIALLSVKIDRIDIDLTQVSHLLITRISASYKRSRIKPVFMFFSSNGFADFLERLKYLKSIQQNDRKILIELQTSRNTHQDQKDEKKKKQEEMEALQQQLSQQKKTLDQQKVVKADLLRQTQNDEARYQQLLASARSELSAIQAIIAGQGTETELGQVKTGDKIATVIQGSSCNSSGTHLHFIVAQNKSIKNPFSYLKSTDHINCSGPGECSSGDDFNPSGSWDWPINPRIRFSQGFGDTWAVHNTWVGQIYSFHNGIDIKSESSSVVKAVKNGNLFRGSYTGQGGCGLGYVRVAHDEGDFETYYFHVI